jgi:hypothetical protein
MSFFPKVSLIRRRYSGGEYVKGQWHKGTPVDAPFKSSWQPVTGKALEMLPEGKRSGEVYKAFPDMSLDFTSADAHAGVAADIVVWNGKEYEVTVAALWNNGLIPHWEIVCTRPKEGEA